MCDKECIPYAPALIEAMRSLGYSFSSAIADLIDNSISAGAKNIEIYSEPSSNPSLEIIDDGKGMSKDKLFEAMRYGSSDPRDMRGENDLGRFGLGLKSASLSQCKRLIVISKQGDNLSGYSWDLDYVVKTGSWMLKGFTEEEMLGFPNVEKLMKLHNGTYVYLSEFDRIKEGTSDLSATFRDLLNEMSEHLSLVFHRFISEDGLMIRLNNTKIESKDPFLLNHKATQIKKEQSIYINDVQITLKPYILPHISKLTASDLEMVGGKENLKNNQGFYVYRNKRLIVWGTWFRLERKDELNKLARVRVDIPNTLDYMWSIDIKKSTAVLPDIIKKNMYSAVYDSIQNSEAVHRYRGRKESGSKEIEYVWEKIKKRDGCEYVINRDIPQIKLLVSSLEDDQIKLLNSIIETLEESFPTSSLYIDVASGDIKEFPKDSDNGMIEELWEGLESNIAYAKSHNYDVVEYYKAFLNVEPYCNYKEIKNRIEKEILKYE